MDLTIYFFKFLASLFAIVNPVGATTVFVSLSQDRARDEVRGIPRRTALGVASIMIVAAFFGKHILAFFGVGIPAFRVGGGILILLISIAMMRARQSSAKYTPHEASESAEKEDISIVPLATPLLAGPGTISTIILHAQSAVYWGHTLVIMVSIFLVGASVYTLFRIGPPLVRKLGKTGINIITRLMGLMLAAVAVEFITGGLAKIFPAFVAPHL